MARYSADHPPREPFLPRKTAVVWHHPFQRYQLVTERTADLGYGLHRSEQLADCGVFCAEHDTKSFAKSLYAALEGDLSLRDLKELRDVFTEALAREEAARAASIRAREQGSR